MASWGSNRQIPIPNLKGFDHDDHDLMMMGFTHSPNKHDHLIQNCDLPPPLKLFSGSPISKSKTKTIGLMSNTEEGDRGDLGVLKALRLSQTRAREAEEKCASISRERDLIGFALMEDSMQVFGYRHLVSLLEAQVTKLKKKEEEVEGGEEGGRGGFSWVVAMALCFGVVGFGFALGCKYNYF